MSRTRLMALALAIGAAIFAAYLAQGLMGAKPKTDVVEVNTAPTTDILVAVKDVQMGDKLAGGRVGWQSWPTNAVTAQMITKANDPNAPAKLEQARARVAIFEGEPILEKKLVMPNQNGFMSAILQKGMRAVSVRVSEETAPAASSCPMTGSM